MPTITDFSAWLATNAEAGGDTTTGITVNTGTAQLIARGIYVDVLDPVYLVGIDTSAVDYLTKVPFQDINLTMLAEWAMAPQSLLTGNATDYAAVTNETVKTVVDLNNYYFGSYSRGYMTAKKSTKDSNQVLQSVTVRVTAYQGIPVSRLRSSRHGTSRWRRRRTCWSRWIQDRRRYRPSVSVAGSSV